MLNEDEDFTYFCRMQNKPSNIWIYTTTQPKFWIFEWYLIFALVPIIFAITNKWSYIISFSILVFCQFLRIKDLTLILLIRRINFYLVGKKALGYYKNERNENML